VCSNQNIVGCGLENGSLLFYDFNSNKTIEHISEAHRDSISSLQFPSSSSYLSSSPFLFLTGSHDGSVKVWDLRVFKTVQEDKQAHQKKYDEAVLAISICEGNAPFFASSGADGLVNIYELGL
jgi:WD40 repeat protein